MSQIFLDKNSFGEQLLRLLKPFRQQCIMLVAGNSYKKLSVYTTIEQVSETLEIDLIRFSAFSPNPSYEEVFTGIDYFQRYQCRGILAVGGGSAIDAAKGMWLFYEYPDADAEARLLQLRRYEYGKYGEKAEINRSGHPYLADYRVHHHVSTFLMDGIDRV